MYQTQIQNSRTSTASKSPHQQTNSVQLHSGQNALLQLQQKIGNRAMTHFLTSQLKGSNEPIQRMLIPVSEETDLEEACVIVLKEYNRQASIKVLPNHKDMEKAIGKIRTSQEGLDLKVARLNNIITKLNENITKKLIPDVVQEHQDEDSASSSDSENDDYPIVTREEIRSHKYFDRTSLLGMLQDPQIEFWTERREPIPSNLALGRIAEYLSKEKLEEEHAESSAPIKVLNGLKISTPQEDEEHHFKDIAEIDNLVVFQGKHGYIPQELIETKAGTSGKQKGVLQSQISKKIKALQDVAEKHYFILLNGKDITDQFDMSAIANTEVTGRDSGIYKTNDIKLNEADIHGIFDFLKLHQRWMVNGGEYGDLQRKGKL